jgi:hypothetical protein
MAFAIVLAPEAIEDFKKLTANARATVRTGTRNTSTARVGENEPQPHQAVARTAASAVSAVRGEIRVFSDVSSTTVEVLAIVANSETESWLAQFGNPE